MGLSGVIKDQAYCHVLDILYILYKISVINLTAHILSSVNIVDVQVAVS